MMESVYRPHQYECPDCEYVHGNSVALRFSKDECDVRPGKSVKKPSSIRVWGRVKAYENEPVEGALVKLTKMVCDESGFWLIGVAHTITDCKGFYQFEIREKDDLADYRVIVGKAAAGKERVIKSHGACHR